MDNFKNILFPDTLKVSSMSSMIPFEFFGEVIPISKKIQFKLGYFSSTSISTLSYGFAQFIYNGGTIDFLINHFVSENDYKLINNEFVLEPDFYNSIQQNIINDIERLNDVLTKKQVSHFYNCLRYLIDNNRISIIPVTTKNGEISHYKEALFWDNEDNIINIVGSCNFTYKGIVCNGESFVINRSWGEASERANIKNEIKDYEKIFKKESKDFIYLKPEKLISIIKQNSISLDEKQLLDEELNLVETNSEVYTEEEFKIKKISNALKDKFAKTVFKIVNEPHFPYPKGPRPYQSEAYENWLKNDRKGLFAMATGTGKTITSLNCVLEDYKINKFYRFIVLVPTISLATQWENEIIKKFNFEEVTICSSLNNSWEESVRNYGRNVRLGNEVNFCIVLTYATFRGLRFQHILNDLFRNQFKNITIIADEAHTLGSPKLLNVLPIGIEKRIGLSATPERQYDEVGNLELSKFFNSFPPLYTFNYNMKKAIYDKVLCKYYYFPIIVELETDELNAYREITNKLNKFLDPTTGKYKDDPYVNMLLIKRKNIIHKARNKSNCLINIIDRIGKNNFKYAFIYVPEGYETNYDENDLDQNNQDDESIINSYTNLLYDKYKFKLKKFTGETSQRDEILNQFIEGKLDALLAMKCLDEGVDIPQTQYAIFCSSTGNPRQYIQRRGRVLRNYGGKHFAYIYDMIVKPVLDITTTDINQIKLEKNILANELKRLVNFAVLAENKMDCLRGLEDLCYSFDIDIYELANIEEEKYNI